MDTGTVVGSGRSMAVKGPGTRYLGIAEVIDPKGTKRYADLGSRVSKQEMMGRIFREIVCGMAVASVCLPLFATDTGAMLYANGDVLVDGHPVTDSIAVIPGSVIETKAGAAANLNLAGATVTLQPETVLKFAGNDLYLDHGGATVASSSQMQVHVKCEIASPVSNTWTQFSVADVSGTIQVAALKGAVGINYGPEFILAKAETAGGATTSAAPAITVVEGQQYNRYEREGCPVQRTKGSPSAASGGILSSRVAQIGLVATGVGIIIGIWPRGSTPVSPTEP